MTAKTEIATFGAGCFWDTETAFRQLPGVLRTSVGFMGGRTEAPTYDQVCIGNTGHAEVVEAVFDPAQISYDALLNRFWKIHDPTTWVKPNPLLESQYRSVIFYHSELQAVAAHASKDHHQALHHNAIATRIEAAGTFTRADASHQHHGNKQAHGRWA